MSEYFTAEDVSRAAKAAAKGAVEVGLDNDSLWIEGYANDIALAVLTAVVPDIVNMARAQAWSAGAHAAIGSTEPLVNPHVAKS